MPRPLPESFEASGQDSFLDVVTNIVGILIILVMVVGMRAKNFPVVAASSDGAAVPAAVAPPVAEQVATASPIEPKADPLQAAKQNAAAVHGDVLQLETQKLIVERELSLRTLHRQQLAAMIAAGEREVEAYRNRLDPESAAEFDARRGLAQVQARLAALRQEQLQWDAAKGPAVEVKNLPTPISKTVHGREAHFLLSRGRVAKVPIEELIERAKSELLRRSVDASELFSSVKAVGPIGGFSMEFTLEPVSQTMVRWKQWQAIPVSAEVGEPVATALADRSEFRAALSLLDPRTTTVTIWMHPDSFNEFRQLKAELYRLGFQTAGRPLPDGLNIAGSTSGTKSAAQ